MHENYTEEINFETCEEQVEVGPKQATINFLKQFARAYTFTGIMQLGLEGYIAWHEPRRNHHQGCSITRSIPEFFY